jgi:hypothetical protein
MLTRKLANPKTALLAGLLLGLTGQVATAAEVVVVYGDDAVHDARLVEASFQARMSENVGIVDAAVKANVKREISRIKAPTVLLALSEVPKRG